MRRAYGGQLGKPSLSLRQFAAALGLRPARYSRYERAEAEPPLTVLTSLRRLTGVSLDRLICGDDQGDENMISAYGLRPGGTVVLGDRMKWVRERSDVTAEQMAGDLRIPLSQYAQWEAGATRPRLEKLHEFSRRLVVPIEFLLSADPRNLDADLQKQFSMSPIYEKRNPGPPPPSNTDEPQIGPPDRVRAGNDKQIALAGATRPTTGRSSTSRVGRRVASPQHS